MPIRMSTQAQQRALRALSLMIDEGLGIMKAAAAAKSSRRSVHKYMKLFGIRTKLKKGKMVIIKSLEQRKHEFIMHMIAGDSATMAAKKANTTINTMKKQKVDGDKIIIKSDRFWVLNVYPLYTHSLVIYGYIVGMDGNIQGNHMEDDGEIRSPDAADIWWQVDFDEFISTLPDYEVGELWKDDIVDLLRTQLEMPLVANETLAERFLGNDSVLSDAVNYDRVDADGNMLLSPLENILSRYQIKMHDFINYGVDDNHPYRAIDYIAKSKLEEVTSKGLFQIFFVGDEPKTYPEDGPLEIEFTYNLKDERL